LAVDNSFSPVTEVLSTTMASKKENFLIIKLLMEFLLWDMEHGKFRTTVSRCTTDLHIR
jgi:hypothetical protein